MADRHRPGVDETRQQYETGGHRPTLFLSLAVMAKSTEKQKKWVSFNGSFTPPCQIFRRFRLSLSLAVMLTQVQ
jgi:hypothetical protein